MSKYIIGDVHGCLLTLQALVDKILKDGGSYSDIVLAGDLIDRGPRSAQVVDYVISNNIATVLGNHEQMMADCYEKKEEEEGLWLCNGGTQTVASYSDEPDSKEKISKHIEFFKSLPLYLEYKDVKNEDNMHLLVTHSSAAEVWGEYSPENPIFRNNVLWERDSFPCKIRDIYNVFGHTPTPTPLLKDFWANLDTGACFNRGQYGKLTCLKFPEMMLFQQENVDYPKEK